MVILFFTKVTLWNSKNILYPERADTVWKEEPFFLPPFFHRHPLKHEMEKLKLFTIIHRHQGCQNSLENLNLHSFTARVIPIFPCLSFQL